MSAVSVSDPEVRFILADAVDLARSALLDLEPTGVGAHLGVRAEDECAATHCFEATLPGYHGWQWAVVVAAAPDTDRVTVSESALLPGPDALIAPEFVPWEQRIQPGDLAPGDLLAPPADDPRLVPGYTATGDPEIDEVAYQVGLGRKQVLSLEGRADAAQRWYEEFGPDSEMAKAAPASCGTCGFYVPLAGALRAAFGVCANAMGADGHVVHLGYGCGAHSETALPTGAGSPLYEAYDDAAVEVVEVEPAKPAHAAGAEAAEAPAAESRQALTGPAAQGPGQFPEAADSSRANDRPASRDRERVSGGGESAGAPLSPENAARVSEEFVQQRAEREAEPDLAAAGDAQAEDLPAPDAATEPERNAREAGDAVPYQQESPAGQPSGASGPAADASGEMREDSAPGSGD